MLPGRGAWSALGERYESAVERVLSGDAARRGRGMRLLDDLSAVATIDALAVRSQVPSPRSTGALRHGVAARG